MLDHLSTPQLQALADGTSASPQADMAHLEVCQLCADRLDALLEDALAPTLGPAPPALTPYQIRRLDRRLFHRLHLAELVRQLVQLALIGPGLVFRGTTHRADRPPKDRRET